MGMSSVKQDVWFGWNVKNFAQNLLIGPRSTWKGRGVNQQQTQRLSFVGGEGGRRGEGVEGGEGGGLN